MQTDAYRHRQRIIALNYQDDTDLTVDANNIPLNGSAAGAVNQSGTVYTVSKTVATTTTVSSSQNPSTYGQSVTFTADVHATSGSTAPTGTVQFVIDGTNFGPAVNLGACSPASTTDSCASVSISTLTVNGGVAHTVVANYTHTDSFVDSSGTLSGGQTVNKGASTTSFTSTAPATLAYHATYAPTATTTGDGTLTIGASGACSISGGVVTITASSGTCTVTATTADGTNYFGSSATPQSITATKATPLVCVAASSTQYSDPATVTAYVGLGSCSTGITIGATGAVTFTVGAAGTVTAPSAGTATGTFTAVSAQVLQAPGIYSIGVSAVFTSSDPNFFNGSGAGVLTVTQEDARVSYNGQLFYGVPLGTTSGTITLSTTVWDISNSMFSPTGATPDSAYDQYPGDIRNATVKFVNRDTGATLCGPVAVGLVNSSDTTTGVASCNYNVTNIPTSGGIEYNVGVIVSGYYTRNSPADNATVTISQTGAGMITGGGYLVLSNNATGMLNPTPGTKNNFGFNVKYNKSGSNLQGGFNGIIRSTKDLNGNPCSTSHPGYTVCVYQVKSTAISSLTTQETTVPYKATYVANANVQDVTNPNVSPVSVDGGTTMTVWMTDYQGTGPTDTIGIQVYQSASKGGGLWYSNNFVSGKTAEQALTGC